jgi:hypothetical protein
MAGCDDPHLSPMLCGKHKEQDHDPGQPEYKVRSYAKNNRCRKDWQTEAQKFMPVILTTQEAEIRKIVVQGQPGQNV